MAVKLRLTRVGKTKQPQYRIVAADARSPRDGRFIEILGQYNPREEPSLINVDNDKIVKWLWPKEVRTADRAGRQASSRSRAPRSSSKPAKAAEVSDDSDIEFAGTAVAVSRPTSCRSIVDDPDAVTVEVDESGQRPALNVRVGDGDLGRVIGRRGRTAASIRTVTRAAASKDDVEIDIEFLD